MALAGVHIESRFNRSDHGRCPGRLSFCHQPLGGRPFAKLRFELSGSVVRSMRLAMPPRPYSSLGWLGYNTGMEGVPCKV